MTPDERRRAGRAVAARLAHLDMSVADIARKSGVSPRTIRGLLTGASWPRNGSLDQINETLGWPIGEISRRATAERADLSAFSTRDLAHELCERLNAD